MKSFLDAKCLRSNHNNLDIFLTVLDMKADFSSHATVRGQEEKGKDRREILVQSTGHREIK